MTLQGGFVAADTERSHSGTKSAKVTWPDGTTISAFGWTGMNDNTEYLRFSYWRYQNHQFPAGDDVTDANIKQFYVFGSNGDFPQGILLIPGGQDRWGLYNNGSVSYKYDGQQPGQINTSAKTWASSQGVWEHWDVYFYTGTGLDSYDGIYEIRVNGKILLTQENYNFQETAEGWWDDFRLGHMAQGTEGAEVWYDELVVTSGGPQAIYVTDSANFDDGDEHEMAAQHPASWENGQINFNLNASALPSGVPLYCHVIKADRTVTTHSIGSL